MKKVFLTLTVAAATLFVACGPSAEEKAAADKKIQDSIASEEAAMMELEAAQAQHIQDTIAAMTMKMKADSLMADSIAKAAKGGKK